MSPFERRLRILKFIITKGKASLNDILDHDVVDINQASLNALLSRLQKELFLDSNKKGNTKYYRATDKAIQNIKA